MTDPSLDSSPLGELAEEFLGRSQRGERPTVDEYAERFPELADQIRAFFPALLVVENLKPCEQDLTESLPNVGRFGRLTGHLGEFRIIREVGRGGMGVVYEAEQVSLGRRVALKVLASPSFLDPLKFARFEREARSAARLHHTNIVPVFGVGEAEGLHYYVMQFIDGAGLDAVLDDVNRLQAMRSGVAISGRSKPSGLDPSAATISLLAGYAPAAASRDDPEGESVAGSATSAVDSPPSVLSAASESGSSYSRGVAHIGGQLAEALEYAHEKGTLHRDIKPANILLDAHGIAWITDFGLAKAAADDDLTNTGDIVGTIRYMAPERFNGRCDARSDVYALGLTLYELLARRPAFDGTDRNTLIRQVGQLQPTRLRRIDPAISRDLETIVHKSIEKDPAHRYATAGAMADDLRCVLEDRPIRARRATSFERAWRWSRRNRAVAALTVVAAAALLVAAVVGWAGYMTTIRALEGEERRRGQAELATRRAEENVALSLEVFQELFQQLASWDALPPPSLGLSVRLGPSPHTGPGGPPPGPPRRPQGGSGNPPRRPSERDTALLRSILTFYERFARKNALDPYLQGEAAWAYRKVGMLNEHLGHVAEADAAYDHAIGIFEELVATNPDHPEYRAKLVETYDTADPWSADPASLGVLERRLVRAKDLIDRLTSESPDHVAYGYERVHVYAKLGMIAHRLGRADEAEAAYGRAIALESELLGRRPDDGRLHYDRATTRHALGLLLIDRKRREEARQLFVAAADEVRSLAINDHSRRPGPELFERLSTAFEDLGEAALAEEMARWAEWALAPRPRNLSPPPESIRPPA